MFSRLKKFDVHIKTVDGVSQQTLLGAFFTLITVTITLALLYSEVKFYLTKDNIYHMVIDQNNAQDTVRLDFDFEFHAVPCHDLLFSQEVIRGTVHSNSDNRNISLTPTSSTSCQVHGYIVTDKVGGNFKFKVKSASEDLINDLLLQQFGQLVRGVKDTDPNLSHTIGRLSFHQVAENKVHSDHFENPIFKLASKTALSGVKTTTEKGIGLYHYNLNVVPTQKKKRGRIWMSRLDKMSVTEREVKLEDLTRGLSLSGTIVKDFAGVIVTYDFYPVVIQIEESKQSLGSFITSLCAIIGGVITIMSLINRCLYSSAKVLIGKKD